MTGSIVATHPNPFADRYRREGHWAERALADLFAQVAAQRGAAVATIDATRHLSFLELDTVSGRLASHLAALGIGLGDVVAYQLPNWWEAVVAFLAATRLGAIVNPLLPIFRASELRFTLAQSRARALLIPGTFRGYDYRQLLSELWPQLSDLEHVIVVRDEPLPGMQRWEDVVSETATAASATVVEPDRIALLMYTSGTTAAPKGVLHTHNSLAAEVMSLRRVHALTPADRTLMPSPLTHISGVMHGILTPALLGTSAVLMERWDPAQALALIGAEHVTYMIGAPTFLQDLLAQAEATGTPTDTLQSFRLFSCGGASVPPELIRRARQRFRSCIAKRVYGSTEFPTITTTEPADATAHGIDSEGRAISPAEVRITDATGTSLSAGAEGEVQARGPECFVGYLDADLNAESFAADGWFRTGDLGVLGADGYLCITGRLKEIVIRKGEKISIKEVEDVVAEHPAVAEVAVIALPDPHTGEHACAAVRLRPGMTMSLSDLQRFLSGRGLATQKWPEELRVVPAFPRTESGKILRPKLKEELLRGSV